MGKYSSKVFNESTKSKNKEIFKGLRILIIAALVAIIFYPPFLQGLFFEKTILPSNIFVFSLYIIFCIYKWLKNDFTMFKTPIEYISLAFVVIYFTSIFTAIHTRSAIIELLKYCMYYVVFYMITDIAEDKKTKLIFLWTITASAVGVSIIGLDSAIGGNFVNVINKMFNFFGVPGNIFFGLFVDNRINSTLQYPNALASYVMAIFFVVIGFILSSKNVWVKIVGGIFAYILFLTFMLTKSRGAQLLFPIAIIIFMLVSQKANRIKVAVHSVLLAVPAVYVSLVINPYLSEVTFSKKALVLMVIGLIITGIMSLIISKIGILFQKISWKIYLIIVLILIIVLPLGLSFALNSSVPLQLSHNEDEAEGEKIVSKDIALIPGKEYIFTYNAYTSMQEDKPFTYNLRISSKSRQNILSSGDTQIKHISFKDSSNPEVSIQFTVPNDSKLINICFLNYYAGTSVTLDNAKITDSLTGKTVKKIVLKNKYNLDNILNRFDSLQFDGSVLTRMIYYKDGIKIFSKVWLLGGGGGAWNYLYRQYQSFSYQSTQAHNYPLQLAIETGIFGLLVLASLIIALICGYVAYYKKAKNEIALNHDDSDKSISNTFLFASIITAIASLFLHSIIDFDFSEASMLLLFWQLIAIFNNELKSSLTFKDLIPIFFNKINKIKSKKPSLTNKRGKISLSISVVLVIILLTFAASFIQASLYAKKAFYNLLEDNIEEAIVNIIKAIEKDKYNESYIIGYNPVATRPDIKTGLADILLIKINSIEGREERGEIITQTELTQIQRQFALLNNYMERIQIKAKNNLALSRNLASFNFSIGQVEKGLEYLNKSINLYPFDSSLWSSKVDVYYQLITKHLNSKNYDDAKKYLDVGLNVIHEASTVNEKNMTPFVFNKDSVIKLQTMQFIYDYWDKEEELLKSNGLVHYTIPYMDVNLDKVPDQWGSIDTELISLNTREKNILIQVNGDSFIYTKIPIWLDKGKRYSVVVELDKDIDTLSYEILGIIGITPLQPIGQSKYAGEFLVENETSSIGHQFNLHLYSDSIIKSILVISKE